MRVMKMIMRHFLLLVMLLQCSGCMCLTASVRTIGLAKYTGEVRIPKDVADNDLRAKLNKCRYSVNIEAHGGLVFPDSIHDDMGRVKNKSGGYDVNSVDAVVHLNEQTSVGGKRTVPVTLEGRRMICSFYFRRNPENGEYDVMDLESEPQRTTLGCLAQPLILVTVPIDVGLSAAMYAGFLVCGAVAGPLFLVGAGVSWLSEPSAVAEESRKQKVQDSYRADESWKEKYYESVRKRMDGEEKANKQRENNTTNAPSSSSR